MRGKRILMLSVIVVMLSISFGWGEDGRQAWVVRHNEFGDDQAHAIFVSDSGNVYVTGHCSNSDFLTIKYNNYGGFLWKARYDGGYGLDFARGLSVSASGNVYVTGESPGSGSSFDYATIQYSPAGAFLWLARYNGPGNASDKPVALAIDNSGSVYVTGSSIGSGTLLDLATIKYSSGGVEQWVRRWAGSGDPWDEYAKAIAVNASGNVYVTGGNGGIPTLKYSTNGDLLWTTIYHSPANGSDEGRAITLDASGNVYVTGYAAGDHIPRNKDYCTIKYNSSGDTIWVRYYNGPGNGDDWANDIEVDANGNVYVTGFSVGSGTSEDIATIKYSSSGVEQWAARYNGPADGSDYGNSLTFDDDGNIFVTGSSLGSGSDKDYVTIKYNQNGDTVWTRRYNGPGNYLDDAQAIADKNGNVYVTGLSSLSGNDFDFATIKYYPACAAIPGDANASGTITIADVTCINNYIFNQSGWSPCYANNNLCWLSGLLCRGDANGNGQVSQADVIYLVNYIFDKDRPPDCYGSDPGNCWVPVPSDICCKPVP